MAKQIINIGASANDGNGDPLRNAFDKTNDNFNELYFALGNSSNATNLFNGSGEFDLTGKAHKVSFFYPTEAALLALNESTYKGSIGFAQDTGYLYYSDGSDWTKLAKFSELGSGGGSSANTFGTIAVSGQSSIVADGTTDTLTLVAGSNVTLTTNANNDSITIAATASGGGSFANTDVDAHLNVSGASNNEVLSWNGSDYAWISVGGGSGYTDADVNAHLNQSSAGTNEVLSWNGSDYAWVAQGGSGSSTFAALTEINAADLDVHDIAVQAATTLVVTANGTSAYRFDQYGTTDDPTIYVKAGTTVAFDLTAVSSHPFQIQQPEGSNYNTGLVHVAPDGTVSTGSNAQAKTSGVLYWKVPAAISGDYKYQCQAHSAMFGTITVEAAAGGGGGGSLSRTTQGVAASSLADGATGNIEFNGLGKSYALYSVTVTADSWIRIYSDTASRTADASRPQGQDPAEGAGIIAEFVATGGGTTTFKVTPAIYGYVDNSETEIPVAITNNSGGSASITTTLVGLVLES